MQGVEGGEGYKGGVDSVEDEIVSNFEHEIHGRGSCRTTRRVSWTTTAASDGNGQISLTSSFLLCLRSKDQATIFFYNHVTSYLNKHLNYNSIQRSPRPENGN